MHAVLTVGGWVCDEVERYLYNGKLLNTRSILKGGVHSAVQLNQTVLSKIPRPIFLALRLSILTFISSLLLSSIIFDPATTRPQFICYCLTSRGLAFSKMLPAVAPSPSADTVEAFYL